MSGINGPVPSLAQQSAGRAVEMGHLQGAARPVIETVADVARRVLEVPDNPRPTTPSTRDFHVVDLERISEFEKQREKARSDDEIRTAYQKLPQKLQDRMLKLYEESPSGRLVFDNHQALLTDPIRVFSVRIGSESIWDIAKKETGFLADQVSQAVFQAVSNRIQKPEESSTDRASSSAEAENDTISRAIIVAAQNGNLEALYKLFSGGRRVSLEDLGLAVCAASRSGKEDVVRFLLSKGRGIAREDYGKAVIQAAEAGHTRIVDFLLSEGRSIDRRYLDVAIVQACKNDHQEIVKNLLGRIPLDQSFVKWIASVAVEHGSANVLQQCLPSIWLREGDRDAERWLNDQLLLGSRNGHVEVVNALLASRALSDPDIRGALEKAAENGHVEVVEALLKPFPDVYARGALEKAVELGHVEVVKALLAGPALSNWDVRGVLEKVAEKGHVEVVKALLAGRDLSTVYVGGALEKAAEKGHVEVVKALLAQRAPSDEAVGRALEKAAEKGYLEVVKALLAGRDLSTVYVGGALEKAAEKGHVEVVEALLERTGLHPAYVERALEKAAEKGHHEVVGALLERTEIPPVHVEIALGNAAEKGHVEVVKALLAQRAPSDEAVGRALEKAAEKGYLEVVKALLAGRDLSTVYVGGALEKAAEKGHLEVVKDLLAGRDLSTVYVGGALGKAVENGHLEVVKVLLAGRDLSSVYVRGALEKAAGNGHLNVIQFLLTNQDLLGVNVEQMFIQAVANGRSDVIACLRPEVQESKVLFLLEEAICLAAKRGNLEIVKALVSRESISEDCLEKACVEATPWLKNIPVITFLLGELFPEETKETITRVITTDLMYLSHPFTSFRRDEEKTRLGSAIKIAAENDRMKVLEYIFSKVRSEGIPEESLRIAATEAQKKDHLNVQKYILEQLFLKLTNEGNLEGLRAFFDHEGAPKEEIRYEAIRMSAARADVVVLEFLLGKGPISEDLKRQAMQTVGTLLSAGDPNSKNIRVIKETLQNAEVISTHK